MCLSFAFRKEGCDTNYFRNFNSHHPLEQKRLVLWALINRFKSLHQTAQLPRKVYDKGVDYPCDRDYPISFINSAKQEKQTWNTPPLPPCVKTRVCNPSVRGVTEAVRRTLPSNLTFKQCSSPFARYEVSSLIQNKVSTEHTKWYCTDHSVQRMVRLVHRWKRNAIGRLGLEAREGHGASHPGYQANVSIRRALLGDRMFFGLR